MAPRFHEEMSAEIGVNTKKLKTVEHFLRSKQKPIDPSLGGVVETTTESTEQKFRNFQNPSENAATSLKSGSLGTND